jgi:hypothetical protein
MAKAKTQMTAQHKEALAEGRADGRVIKGYLEALEQNRPRRGRKRTPESIKKRLIVIEHEIASASPLHRLQLVQERMDLQRESEQLGTKTDVSSLEAAFVKTAARYADRKGISYAAWRELGVPADVLGRAGIGRSA